MADNRQDSIKMLTGAASNLVQTTAQEGGSFRQLAKDKEPAKPKTMVPMYKMFRFATKLDVFLMTIGAICGCANGGAMAGFSILLGSIFDVLNSSDPSRATGLALDFVWIGLATFFSAAMQVGLFTAVSERMTIKLRQRYLDALLAQDVGYFDANDAGTITSRVAENSLMFREALGEKFAALFQFGA